MADDSHPDPDRRPRFRYVFVGRENWTRIKVREPEPMSHDEIRALVKRLLDRRE